MKFLISLLLICFSFSLFGNKSEDTLLSKHNWSFSVLIGNNGQFDQQIIEPIYLTGYNDEKIYASNFGFNEKRFDFKFSFIAEYRVKPELSIYINSGITPMRFELKYVMRNEDQIATFRQNVLNVNPGVIYYKNLGRIFIGFGGEFPLCFFGKSDYRELYVFNGLSSDEHYFNEKGFALGINGILNCGIRIGKNLSIFSRIGFGLIYVNSGGEIAGSTHVGFYENHIEQIYFTRSESALGIKVTF